MLFVFAGFYTPPQAEAAVGVVVVVHGGHRYHRHYHRRYYHRHYDRR
jgi:alpha-beta hydrolase superfamily lysophospholipase